MTNQDEEERKRRDLIEKRAFEIYESRGGHHGFDREDWDQAQREVDGVSDDALPGDDEDDLAVEEDKGLV
ncbi:MAG: DUF2934 domain-containing protein [Dehalococcoidia bacterium]